MLLRVLTQPSGDEQGTRFDGLLDAILRGTSGSNTDRSGGTLHRPSRSPRAASDRSLSGESSPARCAVVSVRRASAVASSRLNYVQQLQPTDMAFRSASNTTTVRKRARHLVRIE